MQMIKIVVNLQKKMHKKVKFKYKLIIKKKDKYIIGIYINFLIDIILLKIYLKDILNLINY